MTLTIFPLMFDDTFQTPSHTRQLSTVNQHKIISTGVWITEFYTLPKREKKKSSFDPRNDSPKSILLHTLQSIKQQLDNCHSWGSHMHERNVNILFSFCKWMIRHGKSIFRKRENNIFGPFFEYKRKKKAWQQPFGCHFKKYDTYIFSYNWLHERCIDNACGEVKIVFIFFSSSSSSEKKYTKFNGGQRKNYDCKRMLILEWTAKNGILVFLSV